MSRTQESKDKGTACNVRNTAYLQMCCHGKEISFPNLFRKYCGGKRKKKKSSLPGALNLQLVFFRAKGLPGIHLKFPARHYLDFSYTVYTEHLCKVGHA